MKSKLHRASARNRGTLGKPWTAGIQTDRGLWKEEVRKRFFETANVFYQKILSVRFITNICVAGINANTNSTLGLDHQLVCLKEPIFLFSFKFQMHAMPLFVALSLSVCWEYQMLRKLANIFLFGVE